MTFDPSLCLVADPDFCNPHSIEYVVAQSIKGGVSLVQLRSKTLCTRDFLALGFQVKKITDSYQMPLIINDRVDIVQALDADGVHLGQSDMPPAYARALLGPSALIGLSVSCFAQARAAIGLPIDYLGAGPVFQTPTKKDAEKFMGLEELTKICDLVSIPVIGIGGITEKNAREVLKTKAHHNIGIAVVSALCASEDPLSSALKFKRSSS